MASQTNTFEGGTNGTTITTGNSGGGSGTAFGGVTLGDGTGIFDSTRAAHGSLSGKFTTGATGSQSFVQWTTTRASTVYARVYVYLTANPSVPLYVAEFRDSTAGLAFNGAVIIGADGTVRVADSTGNAVANSIATVALNQWVRIEYQVVCNATTGSVTARLYNTADSTTITETVTTTAKNTGTGADTPRYGITFAGTSHGPIWVDDLGWSDTDWLGPVPSGTPITYQHAVQIG